MILGAGPAGNHTAKLLAQLGYDVAVLESKTSIGDKLCTGIVGRECIRRFGSIEPRVFRETGSASLVLPSGKQLRIDMGRPYAYVIDRVHFVGELARKAEEMGASYHQNLRVIGVGVEEDGVWARALVDGREEVYRGRALVLASGFGSRLTKDLGLGVIDQYALGAQTEVCTNGLEETLVYLGKRFTPGFFGWLVPTSQGRGLLGLLARHDPVKHLNRLMESLESQGTVSRANGGPAKWGIPLKPLPKTYGDRVVVVGDAAGQVKPTTGGGIYYALLCAEEATDALHRAFQKNDLSARRLKDYEEAWKRKLGRELSVGFYARRLYEALSDGQIEYLMETIAHNGVHKEVIQDRESSFDWHAELILRGMKHQVVRSVIDPIKSLVPSMPWSNN